MTIKISQLANLTVVQANTIVPVVSNITGTLTTVQANVQQLQDYIVTNGVSANITALYTNAATQSDLIISINANVAAANVGIIGYIGLANTTMKSYVDGQITAANAGITSANLGMNGYVDNAVSTANIGIKGYIDQANTIQSGQVGAANIAITSANLGMKGYVDSQSFYSNAKVSTYLPTYSGNVASITSTGDAAVFGNVFVANTYVPTLANSQGSVGQITWDSSHIYICIAINTWKRANISTW